MAKAPDFSLQDQDGQTHSLQDYAGRWVVLYFYPKDDTPGCTTEACEFRDARDLIAELGNAVVIGISKDTVKAHRKFADKFDLNFTLLSDPEHEVIEAYGAWQEKSMYGRTYMGIQRSTFIIDPSGNIAREYPKVSPKKHAAQIIKDLQALRA
ncbi:MAG TPA: thioredoxin-dependent thiol peroxidase [Candidatus Microsaccharimonas sp.]|nr:thioredoxin-dependent thiol peroxidase [Candidatus Microsaccharimonas sp.]